MSTYLAIFQQTNFLLFFLRTVAMQCLLFYSNWTVAGDEMAIAVGFVISVYGIGYGRLAT